MVGCNCLRDTPISSGIEPGPATCQADELTTTFFADPQKHNVCASDSGTSVVHWLHASERGEHFSC